jgi:methyl-accepting chemotaxis protein
MISRSHSQSSDAAAQAYEINESLTLIDEMIAEINQSTRLIDESSKEQTKAVESITSGIIHINEVAMDNVKDNEKVLALAKTVEDETVAVNEIVQRYKS